MLENETVLYGTLIGDPDWKEEIITTDPTKIDAARAWAEANGFDRLRVAVIDLSVPPDFGATVRI